MLTSLAHIHTSCLQHSRKPQRFCLPLDPINFPFNYIRMNHRVETRLARTRHRMRSETRQRIANQYHTPVQEFVRGLDDVRNGLNKRFLRRTHNLRELRRKEVSRLLFLLRPRARIRFARRLGDAMIPPVLIRHQFAERGRRIIQ